MSHRTSKSSSAKKADTFETCFSYDSIFHFKKIHLGIQLDYLSFTSLKRFKLGDETIV